MIPPEMLSGVNYERPEKVERLAASMRAHGWQGRPLLVEEGIYGRLFAWTGSHRIAAAKAAGLTEVPCRVITAAQSEAARDALPSAYGYQPSGTRLRVRLTAADGMIPSVLKGCAASVCFLMAPPLRSKKKSWPRSGEEARTDGV